MAFPEAVVLTHLILDVSTPSETLTKARSHANNPKRTPKPSLWAPRPRFGATSRRVCFTASPKHVNRV